MIQEEPHQKEKDRRKTKTKHESKSVVSLPLSASSRRRLFIQYSMILRRLKHIHYYCSQPQHQNQCALGTTRKSNKQRKSTFWREKARNSKFRELTHIPLLSFLSFTVHQTILAFDNKYNYIPWRISLMRRC